MKFLHYELYQKLCLPHGEIFQEEWNQQYALYLQAFEKAKVLLPKSFLKEYCKRVSNVSYTHLDVYKRQL